jgi:hypothetical protein
LAHDHVFELFQPIAGYRHDVSSFFSIHGLGRPVVRIVSPSPSDLTKKGAIFGPRAPLRRRSGFCPNPSQVLEITLFSTGRDPVSAQLCHDRPRTPAGPIGRECLNSLSFFRPS